MVKKQSKAEDFRKTVADAFIASIEADPIGWRRQWSYTGTDRPYNAVKGNHYRGMNVLWLAYVAEVKEFGDPRWVTFNQASEKGWKIKAGSKGTRIEYWMPFDNENKKAISWDEYNKLTDHGRKHPFYEDEEGHKFEKHSIRSRLFTVFNGDQIEGIPALEENLNYDIRKSDVVDRVAAGMGVEIIEKKQNRAYYDPASDKITLPLKEQFESDNAYQSTALHELGHATGHPERLSRDHSGRFGSESYAFEELVAEMSSAFMGEFFESVPSEAELDNHKAYVQSWAEEIRKDKNYLFKAIKQAEEAADYMIEAGDLEVLMKEVLENRQAVIEGGEVSAMDNTVEKDQSGKIFTFAFSWNETRESSDPNYAIEERYFLDEAEFCAPNEDEAWDLFYEWQQEERGTVSDVTCRVVFNEAYKYLYGDNYGTPEDYYIAAENDSAAVDGSLSELEMIKNDLQLSAANQDYSYAAGLGYTESADYEEDMEL